MLCLCCPVRSSGCGGTGPGIQGRPFRSHPGGIVFPWPDTETMPELRESAAVELPIRAVSGLLRAAELELGALLVGQGFPFPWKKNPFWLSGYVQEERRAILLPVESLNSAPGSVFTILHTIHTIMDLIWHRLSSGPWIFV